MHFSHFDKTCEWHKNKRVKENMKGNIDNDEITSLVQLSPKMVLKVNNLAAN